MSEDFADKTEAPTPHRRAEARRDGNVARSADLVAALLGFSSILLLGQYGPRVLEAIKLILLESLGREALAPGRMAYLLGTALTPLLAGLTLVAVAANVLQTGFLLVVPKSKDALDPARGFQRIFSQRSSAQLTLNVVKIALVVIVAFAATRGRLDEIVGLQGRTMGEMASAAGGLVYAIALRVALVLLVLAAVDFAYQWLRHERELRMTRREVKEEMRRLAGDPALRHRRRSAAAAAWAASRLQRDVAGASAVITDGDRIAVAIAYDGDAMASPRLAAMGRDATAREIREIALRHGLPIIDRPALAGALLKGSRPGLELPGRFFAAAAEVLAYAQQVRRRKDSSATA